LSTCPQGNEPTPEIDVADYFATAPAAKLVAKITVEKEHGRIETRTYTASDKIDWIASERSYPPASLGKTVVQVNKLMPPPTREKF